MNHQKILHILKIMEILSIIGVLLSSLYDSSFFFWGMMYLVLPVVSITAIFSLVLILSNRDRSRKLFYLLFVNAGLAVSILYFIYWIVSDIKIGF